MKRKNYLILAILVIVVGAYIGYKYLYKSHRNIEEEAAFVKVESSKLIELVSTETTSEILNKTIEVSGIITEIDNQSITLDEAIHCIFNQLPNGLSIDDNVNIKGRFIGYDDLFEIAKLDQCNLTN